MTAATVYLAETCRLLVVVVFAAAAWTKTAELAQFATSLVDHFRVPAHAGKPLAIVITVLEWLVLALLLAGGAWSRAGFTLAVLLLLTFSVVLAEAVMRGRQAYCSCFGHSRHSVSVLDLARNAVVLLASGVGLFVVVPSVSLGLTVQAALLLVAVFCFLLFSNLEDLHQLRR